MSDKEQLTQIVQIVQEDHEQFELLYSKIVSKVYFWCYMIAKKESLAKDMMQESMIKIYNNLNKLDQPEYFETWMYRLVRNTALDYLKANNRHSYNLIDDENYDEDFEVNIEETRSEFLPDKAFDEKQTQKLLREFIDNLPLNQREAITLYYLEEFDTVEISEIMGYKTSSIRAWLTRGRDNLKKQVEEYEGKHNVKLYSSSILPLLIIVLKEYREEVTTQANLTFNKKMYYKKSYNPFKNIYNGISSNLSLVTAASVSIVVITTAIIVNTIYNNRITDIDAITEKVNPYVTNINYMDFPVNSGLEVKIHLKEFYESNDIRIYDQDNKELKYKRNIDILVVYIDANGTYTVEIKGHKEVFKIDNIQENAPTLKDFKIYKDEIILTIEDVDSELDLKSSYVYSKGDKYPITEDFKSFGKFDEDIIVRLVHKNGKHIDYSITNIDK